MTRTPRRPIIADGVEVARGVPSSPRTGEPPPGQSRAAGAHCSRPFPRIDDLKVEELVSVLETDGILLFSFTDLESVLTAFRSLGSAYTPSSTATGLTTLAATEDTSYTSGMRGFTSLGLEPHTDHPANERPAEVVLLVCETPAATGGESILVDGRRVYEGLSANSAEHLLRLSAPSAVFHRFGDEFADVPTFDSPSEGRVRLRARFDEFAYVNVGALPAFQELQRQVHRAAFDVGLRSGEGYAILNMRWLHGRRPFRGTRKLHRLLIACSEEYRHKLNSFEVPSVLRPER